MIIVSGLLMGLWLPLWLVAMMIIGHRFHLYLFDGCLFSRLQSRLGVLDSDTNFLQDAAYKLFSKEITLTQAEVVDQWLLRSTFIVASLHSLFYIKTVLDIVLIFLILIGVSTCWKMMQEARQNSMTCSIGQTCSAVRDSGYSNLFGVKAEVLGVLYFLGMLGCYGGTQIGLFSGSYSLLWACATVGVFVSVYFIYVQAIRLKQYCISCLKTHATSIMLFLIITFSAV